MSSTIRSEASAQAAHQTHLPDPKVPQRRRFWATRVLALAAILLFFLSKSAWHQINSVWPHVLTQLGILLAATGALGRLWCSSYAGGNKNQLLLQVGPYSLTRNPLYFFSFIGGLGIAATTETFTIPVLFAVWFAWYYRKVIQGEEAFLTSKFGTEFDDYRASVPRFVPRIEGFNEPERWTMSPHSFRVSLSEVVWFVIAAVALHAIHDTRAVIGLPSLFSLY